MSENHFFLGLIGLKISKMLEDFTEILQILMLCHMGLT